MLLYASQPSTRLQYILAFVSKEILDQPIRLTTDKEAFCNDPGPKINYSQAKIIDPEFWICSTSLLFETGISAQNIQCFTFNSNKAFYKTGNGDYAFDVLAAAFYLLSRYEEYLPHDKDKFGRYAHNNSLAHKENFLHLPLINIWLRDFKVALLHKYPAIKFNDQQFTYRPTYDIDIAWSYRNKGWWRNTGGFIRSAIHKDFGALKERFQVIFNKKKDPFDSYEWLHQLHQYHQLQPIYFFLLASNPIGVDKNISPLNKQLRDLIQFHKSNYAVGIHPSWQSGDNRLLLEKEIKQLEKITGQRIVYSRQHYLRFSLPHTFRILIKTGIRKEYSMGYGTSNGFRASVASSFFWFDLEKSEITGMRIYPFCFMDANACYENKYTPQQALQQLLYYYRTIKEVNGLMITLWHNNFLGTDRAFDGWRMVYEAFINEHGSHFKNTDSEGLSTDTLNA